MDSQPTATATEQQPEPPSSAASTVSDATEPPLEDGSVYLPLPHRFASRLFGHITGVCAESCIVPRESVVRYFLERTNSDKYTLPASVRRWKEMRMDFDSWIELLVRLTVCECVGKSPHRILWMAAPRTPFQGVDCLALSRCVPDKQRAQAVAFLNSRALSYSSKESEWLSKLEPSKLERERFCLASHLQRHAPVQPPLPWGHWLELVEVLLKDKVLLFHHGHICCRSTCTHRRTR